MAEQAQNTQTDEATAPAVQTSSGFSIVWLIPLVAALIGGWLAWKAWSEAGPTITLTFKTAEGLAAGKTKIKFKDVEVGTITDVDISDDLENVIVTAELENGTEPYMHEGTRFWVVRARVAAGQVSGLSTLFSGAYIGMDPSTKGAPTRSFVGLEEAPIVTAGAQGTQFRLRTDELGSLDVGAPLYYRKIRVGQVARYAFSEDGKQVNLTVFINAPHDERINNSTKFWNASGFDVRVESGGLTINSESMVTVMIGGIAFDPGAVGDPVDKEHVFPLFSTKSIAYEKVYTKEEPLLVYFNESVRGLEPGTSVDFRGIRIGEVLDVRLEGDLETLEFRIPVLIQVETERIGERGNSELPREERLKLLVRRGLRAQLATDNLLTGQLRIEFDFHPEAEPAEIEFQDGVTVLPTVPAPLGAITDSLSDILQQVRNIPIEQIGNDLRDTVHNAKELSGSEQLQQTIQALHDTMVQLEQLTAAARRRVGQSRKTLENLDAVLVQADSTLASAEESVSVESPIYREMTLTLHELRETARSIRNLTSYLERNPDALLRGKRAR